MAHIEYSRKPAPTSGASTSSSSHASVQADAKQVPSLSALELPEYTTTKIIGECVVQVLPSGSPLSARQQTLINNAVAILAKYPTDIRAVRETIASTAHTWIDGVSAPAASVLAGLIVAIERAWPGGGQQAGEALEAAFAYFCNARSNPVDALSHALAHSIRPEAVVGAWIYCQAQFRTQGPDIWSEALAAIAGARGLTPVGRGAALVKLCELRATLLGREVARHAAQPASALARNPIPGAATALQGFAREVCQRASQFTPFALESGMRHVTQHMVAALKYLEPSKEDRVAALLLDLLRAAYVPPAARPAGATSFFQPTLEMGGIVAGLRNALCEPPCRRDADSTYESLLPSIKTFVMDEQLQIDEVDRSRIFNVLKTRARLGIVNDVSVASSSTTTETHAQAQAQAGTGSSTEPEELLLLG